MAKRRSQFQLTVKLKRKFETLGYFLKCCVCGRELEPGAVVVHYIRDNQRFDRWYDFECWDEQFR
jgi:hypothetical protein